MNLKFIEDYPNYIISDTGVVISLNWNGTNHPKIVQPWTQAGKGYQLVNLWNKGGQKKLLLHRLVAAHFVGDVAGMIVDHINFDVKDNKASNLRILTISESNQHRRFSEDRNITQEGNRWVVTIQTNNTTHRKSFFDKESALKHRNEMLKRMHVAYLR